VYDGWGLHDGSRSPQCVEPLVFDLWTDHRWNRREQREPTTGDFFKNRKILGYVDPQLQNRVSLITAMPFSKTDRP
jgi:hypothetical protein